MNSPVKQVVIVGGGITGLAAAFYLQQQSYGRIQVSLVETAPTVGGKITSSREVGFVIEGGPDSFITKKPSALELCRALGLNDELIGSKSARQPTYVWSVGRLHPMPEGIMLMAPTMILPLLRSRLISWPGKLRMGLEAVIPPSRKTGEESLATFVRRRFGPELLNKIAAPLMAGIHAADPEALSLQSTFPMFLQLEQTYGSILRGMFSQRMRKKPGRASTGQQSKPGSMFMTLRGGLQQLVDALQSCLHAGTVCVNLGVTSITHDADQYMVALSDGTSVLADEVVFTTPAWATARMVQSIDHVLASKLREIPYVSTATVSLGFKREDIPHSLDGYGFVVPLSEGRRITACTWASQKFEHRAPADCVLLRVFIGGACAEDLAELDEVTLIQLAREELRTTMGITADPILAKAYRWHKSTPQYNVGHEARVAEIERNCQMHPGLHLAGAAYHGAGIPDCIHGAKKIATQIAAKYMRQASADLALSDSTYLVSK